MTAAGDVTAMSLVELRDAIAQGAVSAAEATRVYFERIAQRNEALNCYHELYKERALRRAKAVDGGEITGPLAGVPLALKDIFCTRFGKTTCSSRMLENFASPYDATVVARLEAAGAIVLGKTNMDEFAMGSSSENCAFGAVRNPHDEAFVPGGSSGGSAAAMAAGLCAGAIGTDTGGSIRQPAAYCGVVGLKPTYGRVSRWGMVAFASSLDQAGPLTRTVGDAALLLSVMAGADAHDSTCADVALPEDLADVEQSPAGLRIGIAKQYLSANNSPAVQRAIERAMAAFRDAGAELVDVDLPHTEYGIPTYYLVATAEASSNLARYDGVHYGHRSSEASDLIDLYARSRSEGFGAEVKRRIMLGTFALSAGYYDAYYNRALKVRRLIRRDFDQAFEQCDAILCPTTTGAAFGIGENVDDPLAMYMNDVYTVPASLAGIPGVSLPGGWDESGEKPLPVGVQLLGRAFGERELLRVARVLEKGVGFELGVRC